MMRKTAAGLRPAVQIRAILAGVAALALAGCVETMPQMQASVPVEGGQSRIAARPGVSPAGATVAFMNLGGAPVAIGQKFAGAMSQALGARNVSSDEAGKAHYLIRGHMSAYAVEGGTAIGYVWDIYDSKRRRLQRLEDEIVVKGGAGDAWAAVDDKALASIAGRSADEIAAFLSNTPEAIAAAGTSRTQSADASTAPQAAAAAVQPAADAPLAYAPVR